MATASGCWYEKFETYENKIESNRYIKLCSENIFEFWPPGSQIWPKSSTAYLFALLGTLAHASTCTPLKDIVPGLFLVFF